MSRSESPSQVFFILLTWLFSLIQSSNLKPEDMYLVYDNMCNVCKLKASHKRLLLNPPFQDAWLNLRKIIDSLHLANHVNPQCHTKYSPQPLKDKHPHSCKLENRCLWMGRFKHIVSAVNKIHHVLSPPHGKKTDSVIGMVKNQGKTFTDACIITIVHL